MNQVKTFFLGVLRITTVIFLVIVGVVALGWGTYAVWQSRQTAKNAPLEKPKKWPSMRVEPLGGVELNLSTMWRNDRLYYQFSVEGYPNALSVARDPVSDRSALTTSAEFTLAFFDGDGFKAFEHKIPLRQMAKIVDASGKGSGLDANDDTYMDADVYRRASSWSVTWNFGTPAPLAEPAPSPSGRSSSRASGGTSKPNWRDVSLWRSLKREMSKEDVRRILGEPGKVTELGFMAIWNYGYPLGGSVTFGGNGLLESWSEP